MAEKDFESSATMVHAVSNACYRFDCIPCAIPYQRPHLNTLSALLFEWLLGLFGQVLHQSVDEVM